MRNGDKAEPSCVLLFSVVLLSSVIICISSGLAIDFVVKHVIEHHCCYFPYPYQVLVEWDLGSSEESELRGAPSRCVAMKHGCMILNIGHCRKLEANNEENCIDFFFISDRKDHNRRRSQGVVEGKTLGSLMK